MLIERFFEKCGSFTRRAFNIWQFLFVGSVPVNPQTGQPDYTAQWIQYYRSIGAMKDAEALEQQLKASKVHFGFVSEILMMLMNDLLK